MTDYFAVFGIQRQPRLDLAALEGSFHRLARACHPDRNDSGDNQRLAELNRAFTVLSNPASRLQHLLALEQRQEQVNSRIAEYDELFTRAAELAHEAADSIQSEKTAQSALARSVADVRLARVTEELAAMVERLEAEDARNMAKLEQLEGLWQAEQTTALIEAARLQQRFSFVQRWQQRLEELLFQIRH